MLKKLFWTLLIAALIAVALKQRQEGFDLEGMRTKAQDAASRGVESVRAKAKQAQAAQANS